MKPLAGISIVTIPIGPFAAGTANTIALISLVRKSGGPVVRRLHLRPVGHKDSDPVTVLWDN